MEATISLIITLVIRQVYAVTTTARYSRIGVATGASLSETDHPKTMSVSQCAVSCTQVNRAGFAVSKVARKKFLCMHQMNHVYLPASITWEIFGVRCYQNVGTLTPFVRRFDGSENFARDWSLYASGFGNSTGEFWLGLDTMNTLTTGGRYGLRVDMEDWDGNTFCAVYSSFSVGPAADKYQLSISGYMDEYSTAGNSMDNPSLSAQAALDGMKFSTMDEDNDDFSGDCSNQYGGQGGWWFSKCSLGDATGIRYTSPMVDSSGLSWYTVYYNQYRMKSMTMSLRHFSH